MDFLLLGRMINLILQKVNVWTSRVGNKHEISGQNVLFATGRIIAQIHTCSESVDLIPRMPRHNSEH